MLKIGFRTDGSYALGLGHVTRCLALADALKTWDVLFWTREVKEVGGLLVGRRVNYIKSQIDWKDELELLLGALEKNRLDILVVDLLAYPPPEYSIRLKSTGVKLVTIHEREVYYPYSDMMINCNSFRNYDQSELCHNHCLGPAYVILRESVRALQPVRPAENVHSILITMGGTDPTGATLKVIRAMGSLSQPLKCVVNLGPGFVHRQELLGLYEDGNSGVTLQENVAELAHSMVRTDLAIAAGGNTMYELCYLGIPAVILSQNIHQLEFAEEMDRRGAVISLGLASEVTEEAIGHTVIRLIEKMNIRQGLSQNGRGIIDGLGKERIVEKFYRLIGGDN